MPAEIVGHLLRRGIKAGVGCMSKIKSTHQAAPSDAQDAMKNLLERLRSPQAIITFGITAIVFFLVTAGVEYAIRAVATNLAIVEATEPNGAIKLPLNVDNDPAKAPFMDDYDGAVEERAGQPSKPVTSSLRGTFRHLSSIGGFRSRWRGLSMGIFYSIAFTFFSVGLSAVFSIIPVVGLPLGRIAAAVITCNLHAAWTHATIAMPMEKPFFQRFLSRKTARHLILPNIRLQLGLLLMQVGTGGAAALTHRIILTHRLNWLTVNALLLPVAVFFLTALFHVLPSQIALIRIEASLLPEDRSAVVSFDRTFGGRISWESFTSRKMYVLHSLSIRGAFKTFDRATYKRVVKIFIKFFMIMTAISVVFFGLFVAEFYALAGKQAKEVAESGMGMSWNF
jgi:hypothetical protein